MFEVPGVNVIGGPGPPEQSTQVLADALPQDLTGTLALLAAANHKLIQVGRGAAHRLLGDDGRCTVPAGRRAPSESPDGFVLYTPCSLRLV